MREWWDRAPDKDPTAILFPNSAGTRNNRDSVRKMLARVAALAELLLEERGQNPLPEHAKTHDGRRTAVNWFAIAGYPDTNVMSWVGHSSSRLTSEVYKRVLPRAKDPRIVAAQTEVPETERHPPVPGVDRRADATRDQSDA